MDLKFDLTDDEDSGLTEQEWLERKFESIRHNIYKLGPYLATDLKSWRVKLLLAPMPLRYAVLQ